jgi:hypothetical protein
VEALESLCLLSPLAGGGTTGPWADPQHGPALVASPAPASPMQMSPAAAHPVYNVIRVTPVPGNDFVMNATVKVPNGEYTTTKTVPKGCCVPGGTLQQTDAPVSGTLYMVTKKAANFTVQASPVVAWWNGRPLIKGLDYIVSAKAPPWLWARVKKFDLIYQLGGHWSLFTNLGGPNDHDVGNKFWQVYASAADYKYLTGQTITLEPGVGAKTFQTGDGAVTVFGSTDLLNNPGIFAHEQMHMKIFTDPQYSGYLGNSLRKQAMREQLAYNAGQKAATDAKTRAAQADGYNQATNFLNKQNGLYNIFEGGNGGYYSFKYDTYMVNGQLKTGWGVYGPHGLVEIW